MCNCYPVRECPACFCFQSRRKTSYRQSCDTLGHFSLVTKVSFFRIPTRAMTSMATVRSVSRCTMPANENKSRPGSPALTPTCFLYFLSLQIVELPMGPWAGDGPGAPLCLLAGYGLTCRASPTHLLGSQAQWVWPLPVGCPLLVSCSGCWASSIPVCNIVGISRGLHSQLCPDDIVFSQMHSVSTQAFLTLSLTSQGQWQREPIM